VTVRFWAGARRAAGHPEESSTARTLRELRPELVARSELSAVIPASSFLVDGRALTTEDPLPDGAVVDVLPPFAGGSRA
jgi:molybdopterin synthase sulfur carrier subunit